MKPLSFSLLFNALLIIAIVGFSLWFQQRPSPTDFSRPGSDGAEIIPGIEHSELIFETTAGSNRLPSHLSCNDFFYIEITIHRYFDELRTSMLPDAFQEMYRAARFAATYGIHPGCYRNEDHCRSRVVDDQFIEWVPALTFNQATLRAIFRLECGDYTTDPDRLTPETEEALRERLVLGEERNLSGPSSRFEWGKESENLSCSETRYFTFRYTESIDETDEIDCQHIDSYLPFINRAFGFVSGARNVIRNFCPNDCPNAYRYGTRREWRCLPETEEVEVLHHVIYTCIEEDD